MTARRLAVAGAIACAAVAAAWIGGATARDDPPGPAASKSKAAESRPPNVGCSAASCHGRPESEARPAWVSSAVVWARDDRHALAFEVLKGDLSKRIIARMGETVEAPRNRVCLACHSDPALADRDETPAIRAAREAGVGCQACHGPAERWLAAHLSWNDATNRDAEYDAHRMTRLYDLGVRAAICAGCHVGAPEGDDAPVLRDVNHDLIAAGHPSLNFELSSFLRRMPPHWNERDRTARGAPRRTDYETAAWSAGQGASLRAALVLLDARLERARTEGRALLPDFSEFDCYDCHHDLSGGARPAAATGGRRGTTGWRRGDELLRFTNGAPAARDFLQELSRWQAPPGAAAELGAGLRLPPAGPKPVLDWLNASDPKPDNWHEADWLFHALAAVERDRRSNGAPLDPELERRFKALADGLRTGTDAEGRRVYSPEGFDPGAIRAPFADLLSELRLRVESRP